MAATGWIFILGPALHIAVIAGPPILARAGLGSRWYWFSLGVGSFVTLIIFATHSFEPVGSVGETVWFLLVLGCILAIAFYRPRSQTHQKGDSDARRADGKNQSD